MRIIDGEIMFTVADCSCYIKKSVQTLHIYDKYSDILENKGEARHIPKPIRINGQRLYTKEQVKEIQHFVESKKKYGMMSEYNRKSLGKRGKEIEKRIRAREKEKEQKTMQEENKESELEVVLSKVNRAVDFKDRFKHINKNL
jgi:DNA-binding transcriptional MerR regulator